MPPATPKLAFAPEGVPVIQPPPVKKSHGAAPPDGVDDTEAHPIPDVAEAKITFTPANISTMCNALTVITPKPALCSLMITYPPSARNTNWFAAPVTAIAWPLMTRPVTWTTAPLTVATPATQASSTRDMTKSATMVVAPPKKLAKARLTLATEASEEATVPPPMTAACEAPTVSPLTTVVSSAAASSAPPVVARLPAFATD